MQRGWSADDCKAYCRPGCRQAKTGGEHFCVVGKKWGRGAHAPFNVRQPELARLE